MTSAPKIIRRSTFAEREFGDPIPQQMKRNEITRAFRVKLFTVVRDHITIDNPGFEHPEVVAPWDDILYDLHIDYFAEMPDEWSSYWSTQEELLKAVFVKGDTKAIYGLLEFILRHPRCPPEFGPDVNAVLESTQAAFRIVDGDTFAPYASEEEAVTVAAAMSDLADPQLAGAKEHYKKAAAGLSDGDYAGSMRESIHAVESLTKALTGKSTVQNGLKALASQGVLHVTLADASRRLQHGPTLSLESDTRMPQQRQRPTCPRKTRCSCSLFVGRSLVT